MSSAYGIGPGKTVKLSKITDNQAPTPKLSSKVTEELGDKFKSRSTKPEPAQPSHDESPDAPAPPKLSRRRLYEGIPAVCRFTKSYGLRKA